MKIFLLTLSTFIVASDFDLYGDWVYRKIKAPLSNTFIAKAAKKVEGVQMSPPQDELVTQVSAEDAFGLTANFYVPSIPASEQSFARKLTFDVIRLKDRYFSLHLGPRKPPVSDDYEIRLTQLFPDFFKEIFPTPKVPKELLENPKDITAALALNGPFAPYLKKTGENEFTFDFSWYQKYRPRQEFLSAGCQALMTLDNVTQKMKTTHYQYEGKTVLPGDQDWCQAEKSLLCAMNSFTSINRHLAIDHLLLAAQFAANARNFLPVDHNLRVFLEPHIRSVLAVNSYQGPNLIGEDESVFPRVFPYSKEVIFEILDDQAKNWTFAQNDFMKETQSRGLLDDNKELIKVNGKEIPYRYFQRAKLLHDAHKANVQEWINAHYKNDSSVEDDTDLKRFLKGLNYYLPYAKLNEYLGEGPLTKKKISRLLTNYLDAVEIQHEIVGDTNYHLASHPNLVPTVLPVDGSNPPLDVAQRLLGTLLITSVESINLNTDDFSVVATKESDKRLFKNQQQRTQRAVKELEDSADSLYDLTGPFNPGVMK